MTKDEALKLALEALKQIDEAMPFPVAKLAQAAIKEALAQPEPNYKKALEVWLDKTEWVQETVKPQELGMHRADVLKQRIEAALAQPEHGWTPERIAGMARLKEAQDKKLAQLEQEPVAWLLTDKNINSLQVDSIQRLIDRLKHAHHTDLCVRINGQDEWFQADWLKHMVRASPPQRTWVGLTDEEVGNLSDFAYANDEEFVRNVEKHLKEKNSG